MDRSATAILTRVISTAARTPPPGSCQRRCRLTTWSCRATGLMHRAGSSLERSPVGTCRNIWRNVLAVIPKGSQDMVASIIRTIFAQPDREHIEKQFREVTTMLARSHPKVAAMLVDAQPNLLAFAAFPPRHWRQIWSTNPLKRVNKEIKRRTDVVGVFLKAAALLRLAGSVLID
ncbi:hypothetical protein E3T49_14135 [Cryobacterium cryoconiti]|uniref:Mutator family transposase n=1 Tax=Cryobacterium cryoconiti TaxID=1259239 RepID=A0A4Y8JS77_9MICO|nr:hypothetical protein E3T49_14135 [Cryobacterium cryoconiti]